MVQVAALRSLSNFATLSEEAAGQLRRVLIPLLSGAAQRDFARSADKGPTSAEDPNLELRGDGATLPGHDDGVDDPRPPPSNAEDAAPKESESSDGDNAAPVELLVEALGAARRLLGSFPGMQNDILPLIGRLFCCQTGAAATSHPAYAGQPVLRNGVGCLQLPCSRFCGMRQASMPLLHRLP